MRKVDIGILRELTVDGRTLTLQPDIRRSFHDIAERLDVTEDTVRNRIRFMKETGLIKGWRLGINPSLLGYRTEYLLLKAGPSASKERAVELAGRAPQAISLLTFVDGHIGITMSGADIEELDRLIAEIGRAADYRLAARAEIPFPPASVSLTETDQLIVNYIRQNPRRPYKEIAVRLGVSYRTVKRRVEKMLDGRALFAVPQLDLARMEGGVLAGLDLRCASGLKAEAIRQILGRYGDLLFATQSNQTDYCWFMFILPNLATAKEIEGWVGSLDGAKEPKVRVVEEVFTLVGGAP